MLYFHIMKISYIGPEVLKSFKITHLKTQQVKVVPNQLTHLHRQSISPRKRLQWKELKLKRKVAKPNTIIKNSSLSVKFVNWAVTQPIHHKILKTVHDLEIIHLLMVSCKMLRKLSLKLDSLVLSWKHAIILKSLQWMKQLVDARTIKGGRDLQC